MLVTIIADAAYDSHTKAAGYGYWIASQRGKLPGCSYATSEVVNPRIAEVNAILEAVRLAWKARLLWPGDQLLIQTDCLGAIQGLGTGNIKANDGMRETRALFKRFIKRHRLELEFRHVRGHTTQEAKRFRSQDYCDRYAKDCLVISKQYMTGELDAREIEPTATRTGQAKEGIGIAASPVPPYERYI